MKRFLTMESNLFSQQICFFHSDIGPFQLEKRYVSSQIVNGAQRDTDLDKRVPVIRQ